MSMSRSELAFQNYCVYRRTESRSSSRSFVCLQMLVQHIVFVAKGNFLFFKKRRLLHHVDNLCEASQRQSANMVALKPRFSQNNKLLLHGRFPCHAVNSYSKTTACVVAHSRLARCVYIIHHAWQKVISCFSKNGATCST